MEDMTGGQDLIPVLVLDGEWPSALAIVRSLGRKRIPVEVGSSKTHPLAAQSKFCSNYFIYPDPLADFSGFQKAVLHQLHQRSYSLVIPVTDLTIGPLMKIRNSVEAFSPLAMASNESLSVVMSKSRTSELARSLDIPVPKTLVVRDIQEFHDVKEQLAFPVVVKPDQSKAWPSNGRGLDISVTYALNSSELNEKVSMLIPWCWVVLQEYVRGEGVGVAVLAKNGKIIVSFQYRRLHEVPLTGGPSSYRVSEPIDPKMINYVSTLMNALHWDGVAMVEFKRDKETGKSYLMEINGRFWGSLPLAVAAGANFPFYLFEFMLHQKCDFPSAYKVGLRCRQLSKEIEWLKAALFTRKKGNPIAQFPTYRSVLFDTIQLMNPMERSDTLDLWDPKPAISDLGRVVRRSAEFAWDKYTYSREKRRMIRISRNQRQLKDRFRRAKNILIVCHGNFIRSPFAARLLSHRLGAMKSASVLSAGLDVLPGRRAHPNAISKAKSLGFDLSDHVAIPLTGEMIEAADIIFVMEIKQLLLMLKRFPGVREKTFLLDCLGSEGPREIPDPDAQSDTMFELCFGQIIKALEQIAPVLAQHDIGRGREVEDSLTGLLKSNT